MARPRIELQTKLEEILGSSDVWFQSPGDDKLHFPCIIYNRDRSFDIFSDNGKYIRYKGYSITHIGKNPDDPVLDQIEVLPMCSFVRHYVADNLNHDVFLIYH
jgi:hypothetical protein